MCRVMCAYVICKQSVLPCNTFVITINFLNIRTPEELVVITLKVEQDGVSLEQFIQKMQRELQTV